MASNQAIAESVSDYIMKIKTDCFNYEHDHGKFYIWMYWSEHKDEPDEYQYFYWDEDSKENDYNNRAFDETSEERHILMEHLNNDQIFKYVKQDLLENGIKLERMCYKENKYAKYKVSWNVVEI